MKKFLIFLLVVFMCVTGSACSLFKQDDFLEFNQERHGNMISKEIYESPTNETIANTVKPDEREDTSANTGVVWCGSLDVTLKNAEMIKEISPDGYEGYTDPGDTVCAEVRTKNGLNVTQPIYLMVFADGIPVEFTVDGMPYTSYLIYLSPEEKKFEIVFDKNFDLSLGRLDFVVSFATNPRLVFPVMSYTIWIELNNEPAQPSVLYPTVEQREGVRNCYSGDTYGSWIWNKGVILEEMMAQSRESIELLKGETVLLEAIAGKAGLYRTVLILNDTPVAFQIDGQKAFYIDWESTGSNMLQLPITVPDLISDGSLYTINIPLSPDTRIQQILASGKTELDVVEKP